MNVYQTIRNLIRQSDLQQLLRLGNIARFFAALLIVTIIARGTAGATMPTVTVQNPSSGTVSRSIQTNGTISYAGGTPFTLPAGLLVTGVPVQVGQHVKAGDTLATFDTEELARAVASKQAALQQAQIQAAQQAEGDSADPFNAQLAQAQLERAYEETKETYADGQESVERALQKYEDAAKAVESARNAPLDPSLSSQDAEAQKQAQVEAATAALEAAEEGVYQAKKAAEAADEAAQAAAQSAEDNRNSALHTLEKEEENTAKQNELDRASAAVSAAQAATLQAELNALLALQQSEGRYVAPQNGVLVQLDLHTGEESPSVGGLIADENADYTLEVQLDEDQAKLIAAGTLLHIVQSKVSGDAAVQNISEADGDGNVTATATLPQAAWSAGAATVTATVQSGRQDLVVPASALHQDNNGTYVLIVEEKNTVLGLQNVLQRIAVTVLESGDSDVAISGALDHETQIVVSSSKTVRAGDKVRIAENVS